MQCPSLTTLFPVVVFELLEADRYEDRNKQRFHIRRVLFELADVSEDVAREALRLASHKLPVRCKFVKREELDTVKEGDAE